MRRIIAPIFVSLDGVMQAPGGPEEDPTEQFALGGWTYHYQDDLWRKAMGETFTNPFDLVLGRKTYDIFAAHWPHIENNFVADLFNRVTKFVATRSDMPLTWNNSVSLGIDVVARLEELKASEGPVLLVQGSSDLLQTLIEHNLVDEYRLLIFPVVLGHGKKLFGKGAMPTALKLTASAVSTTGVILATYQPAGEIKTGSFQLKQPSKEEIERRKNLK